MSLELDYFYGQEAEQYSFYRIPKVLLTDRHFKSVSMDAKVLYGLMLDRMGLSMRNGWLDSEGRVYIYFTLEDALEMLDCGKDKAVRLFKELDRNGGIGLIERRKQGQGKPARIYVKNFTVRARSGDGAGPPLPSEAQTSEMPKSGLPAETEVLISEKPKSAVPDIRGQDFRKAAANKTEKNNTELIEPESSIYIYPPPCPYTSPPFSGTSQIGMRADEMDTYRDLIKENIDYDGLLLEYPMDAETLDGYVELMVEVCCSGKAYTRVSGENFPTDVVRSRILKLDRDHIGYVLESMRSNTTPIRNIKAYTLAALYNAPVTISQYYTSLVSSAAARGIPKKEEK